MSQDPFVDLVRLSNESEIARKINVDDIITRFPLKKANEAPLNAPAEKGIDRLLETIIKAESV